MFTNLKVPTLAIALSAWLSPGALADGLRVHFAKETRHGTLAVGYSSGPSWSSGRGHGHRAGHRHHRFVPGRYETILEKIWIPGCSEKVWVAPAYGWRRDAWGRLRRVCVSGGHYEVMRRPGHYETREVRVWVDGRWRD